MHAIYQFLLFEPRLPIQKRFIVKGTTQRRGPRVLIGGGTDFAHSAGRRVRGQLHEPSLHGSAGGGSLDAQAGQHVGRSSPHAGADSEPLVAGVQRGNVPSCAKNKSSERWFPLLHDPLGSRDASDELV